MLVLSFLQLQPDSEVFLLQVMLFIGLTIIGLSYRFTLLRLPKVLMPKAFFWSLIIIVTLALLMRVVLVYWGQFQFVSWKEAYDIRFTGSDIATAAGLAYPINWLSFVFLPLLMSIALLQKRPWLLLFAAACSILLFATQGMKHILFSSPYILLMYLLLRRSGNIFGLRIVWVMALFLIGFASYVVLFNAGQSSLAMFSGANIVLRIFGNNGLLMGSYQAFFSNHPLTHYSSVTGVNLFIHYPYENPIGVEISLAAGGPLEWNQNAGFWATDGLSAMGLPGIVLISLLMALVFYVLDCVSSRHKAYIVALCLSQYVLILINVSFFTSLITGGLAFFFVIFYLMPEIVQNAWVPLRRSTVY